MSQEASWDQYSKLVLKQLETLSIGIDALRHELQGLHDQIAEMRVQEERIEDLRAWKDRVDEVVSPTQMSSYVKDIEELKMFKTKAVTIFAGVQFVMGMALTIIALL